MALSPLVRDLLINGLMAGTAAHKAKKASVGIAYYALAGGIGCLALVFFSIAGYSLLLETYATPVAAAITGSVILLVSLGIGTYGYVSLHKKKLARKMAPHDGLIDSIEGTLKSVLGNFEDPVKDNPKLALLAAALAGFAAGDKLGDHLH